MILLAVALQLATVNCEQALTNARSASERRAFSDAAKAFEGALSLCPNRATVLVPLAQTRIVLGDEAAAEAHLREALAIAPRDSAALYSLGRLYYSQGRYPEAVTHLLRLTELEPANYRAHDHLALCYDMLQNDPLALKHFFRALDLVKDAHRDYDWAFANTADFFLKRDQFDKAFQLAAEAAARNPQSARNAYLTGTALVKLHRDEQALRWLTRAVELDPAHAEARFQLGHGLRRLGREEEARAQLDTFRQLKAAREVSKSGPPSPP
ncbi:MAG: tetratricopeptide repeat protein [Acidobacteriota bacterium]